MFQSLIKCFRFHFYQQSLVDLQWTLLGGLVVAMGGVPKTKRSVYKSNKFQSCVKTLIISK